jgi:hypothetical protein
MPFDKKTFRKVKFEDRTAEVPVPDLRDWFGENDEPVFIVRGLTAEELARCNEAVQKNRNVDAMVQALGSGSQRDKVEALREMLGVTESVPDDLAKRLEQFALGTVEPDMDHEMAVKFAEAYPVEFYQLTNKIMKLTGQGRQIAKKKSSSPSPESEPA